MLFTVTVNLIAADLVFHYQLFETSSQVFSQFVFS